MRKRDRKNTREKTDWFMLFGGLVIVAIVFTAVIVGLIYIA